MPPVAFGSQQHAQCDWSEKPPKVEQDHDGEEVTVQGHYPNSAASKTTTKTTKERQKDLLTLPKTKLNRQIAGCWMPLNFEKIKPREASIARTYVKQQFFNGPARSKVNLVEVDGDDLPQWGGVDSDRDADKEEDDETKQIVKVMKLLRARACEPTAHSGPWGNNFQSETTVDSNSSPSSPSLHILPKKPLACLPLDSRSAATSETKLLGLFSKNPEKDGSAKNKTASADESFNELLMKNLPELCLAVPATRSPASSNDHYRGPNEEVAAASMANNNQLIATSATKNPVPLDGKGMTGLFRGSRQNRGNLIDTGDEEDSGASPRPSFDRGFVGLGSTTLPAFPVTTAKTKTTAKYAGPLLLDTAWSSSFRMTNGTFDSSNWTQDFRSTANLAKTHPGQRSSEAGGYHVKERHDPSARVTPTNDADTNKRDASRPPTPFSFTSGSISKHDFETLQDLSSTESSALTKRGRSPFCLNKGLKDHNATQHPSPSFEGISITDDMSHKANKAKPLSNKKIKHSPEDRRFALPPPSPLLWSRRSTPVSSITSPTAFQGLSTPSTVSPFNSNDPKSSDSRVEASTEPIVLPQPTTLFSENKASGLMPTAKPFPQRQTPTVDESPRMYGQWSHFRSENQGDNITNEFATQTSTEDESPRLYGQWSHFRLENQDETLTSAFAAPKNARGGTDPGDLQVKFPG